MAAKGEEIRETTPPATARFIDPGREAHTTALHVLARPRVTCMTKPEPASPPAGHEKCVRPDIESR